MCIRDSYYGGDYGNDDGDNNGTDNDDDDDDNDDGDDGITLTDFPENRALSLKRGLRGEKLVGWQ